jgi:galactonate dehydratase
VGFAVTATPMACARRMLWRSSAKPPSRQGLSCFKTGLPAYYEWIETRKKISTSVKSMQMLRESLGPDIDIAVDFHAKTSPSVASILVREVEPLNLLFIEEL